MISSFHRSELWPEPRVIGWLSYVSQIDLQILNDGFVARHLNRKDLDSNLFVMKPGTKSLRLERRAEKYWKTRSTSYGP